MQRASSANPFEALILLAVCEQGAAILAGLGDSQSIEVALPPGMAILWAALYTGGGFMAFSGLLWPGSPLTAVEIRRAGLAAVAAGGLVYGLAALTFGGDGLPTSIIHLHIAAAAIHQLFRVTSELRMARRILRSDIESGA